MALRYSFPQLLYSKLTRFSNPIRHGSYKSSPFLEDIEEPNIKYEVSNDPDEWKYVERSLPLTVVPDPVIKESYPSGWKPQVLNQQYPYFIERTKNHMIPVYLKISQRGVRRHTIVKRIKGDINILEKELVQFLQKESFQPIRSQVNEFAGLIRINGDFVNAAKYFIEQKNL